MCCCGCATCGGILDDPTLSPSTGLGPLQLLAGVYDAIPFTNDYATHPKYLMRAWLAYEPTYSTATVQVFSGANSLFRVTLRLEDDAPPVVSVALTAAHAPPAMSSGLIGDLDAYYGAVFQCDDSASGWTMTLSRDYGTTYFYSLMRFEGITIVSDAVSFIPTVPVPDSWCCPNGNNDAMGGGNCGEADEAPDTAILTIAGFVDQPSAPWATLNGDFTLTKTSEAAYSDRYVGIYAGDTQTTGGCQWRYTGYIVVPKTGFPSAQCNAAIFLAPVSAAATCYGTVGQVLYGLQDAAGSLGMYISWKWSPLGCQFGYFELNGGAYLFGGSPDNAGRPTRLAW